MKIFITGGLGQVGYDIAIKLVKLGHQIIVSGKKERRPYYFSLRYIQLDITNQEQVFNTLTAIHPDIIIHCAAWTNVDEAEKPKNHFLVYNTNFSGTKFITRVCKIIDATMIYISTDYVFNGRGTQPWDSSNTIDLQPVNYYGQTKLEGEKIVQENLSKYFIVRISWVFGLLGQKSFVRNMLQLGERERIIKVINDQYGLPTYTKDLAKFIETLIISNNYGIYHVTNSGQYISWFDFACEIFEQAKYSTIIIPIATKDYSTLAKRPQNSRLKKSDGVIMPNWKNALNRHLKELGYV